MQTIPFVVITVAGLMVAIAGLFVVGIFVLIAVSVVTSFVRNSSSPRLAREACVLSKRLRVSSLNNKPSTYYYVTFEFSDKSREEFSVSANIYGLLAEGDMGTLHSQGTYVWEFNRQA